MSKPVIVFFRGGDLDGQIHEMARRPKLNERLVVRYSSKELPRFPLEYRFKNGVFWLHNILPPDHASIPRRERK